MQTITDSLIAEGEKVGVHMERIRIAKKMLKKGFGIEIIREVTGLTGKEIEKLVPTSQE